MALKFVTGRSGAGKTYHLYRTIIRESMEHPEKHYMVLVPEQFTLQTQSDLVRMHPNHGILNIDVLSFQRLAYRIFEELGIEPGKVLEDTGKNLLIRRIVQEHKDEFRTFGSNLKRMGTVSGMKSMVSELTQYGVTPDMLSEIAKHNEEKPQLKGKLDDMELVYGCFKEEMKDRYITAEEILEVLYRNMDRSKLLKGSVIALDGFTGFTPVQNKVLEKLLPMAEDVLVSVTMDEANPFTEVQEQELFAMSKKMMQSLVRIAHDFGTPILPVDHIAPSTESRFGKSTGLQVLENRIFRPGSKAFEGEQNEIRFLEHRTPTEETAWTASEISHLIKEGYAYKDIAVVCGDLGAYTHLIENVFGEYEIPVFLDYKRSVLQNAFVELLRAILQLAEEDYSYESMFRLLRCGLTGISEDEIDRLENYCLAMGIRGRKKWSSKWIRLSKNMETEELNEINRIREQVYNATIETVEILRSKKKNVREKTEALYRFTVTLQVENILEEKSETFAGKGEKTLAAEYHQIYPIMMNLFDKTVELLGEELLPADEYKEILEAGFSETKIGIVPSGSDLVLVGDIERTRLKDIRVLFFLGVNDVYVPKNTQPAGILSELDREILSNQGLTLSPTPRERAFMQQFYLYLNMTKPSELLYVSWCMTDASGKAMRPSYLTSMLRKMFPQTGVEHEPKQQNVSRGAATKKAQTEMLKEGLLEFAEQGTFTSAAGEFGDVVTDGFESQIGSDIEPGLREMALLYRYLSSREDSRAKLMQILDGAFPVRRDSSIGKAAAQALYGLVLDNNVSRLERYAQCAYAHFLQYGLSLKERETYSFENVDMGNVFHKALEAFFLRLGRSTYTAQTLPEEVRDAWCEEVLTHSAADYGNSILQDSSRNRYMIERMTRILKRSVWALCEQMKVGSFEPEHCEISFDHVSDLETINIALSEEEKMRLKGRIDRIDTCEEETRVLVKIIDYKSGSKSFDLAAVYHGLQLQLVVYLNAALELEKKDYPGKDIVPAGILYFNLDDPLVDDDEDDDVVKAGILKSLKPDGLINSDDDVIWELDHTMPGTSAVIPIAYKNDGTLAARGTRAATPEQFDMLSSYVNEQIRKAGREILSGKIGINPYRMGTKNACEYCDYKDVCKLEHKDFRKVSRSLKKYAMQDVWDLIEKGEGHE